MRERLTAAFVVLSIVLLFVAGAVRTYVLRDVIREQVAVQVTQEADLVAAILHDRTADGREVTPELLDGLVGDDERISYDDGTGAPVVASGSDYDEDADPEDDISGSSMRDGTTVTVSQSRSVMRDILGRDIGSIAALFLLIAVAAGIAGFLIATVLSAPFQRLALAAAALGRGRFDLDLPETRIPEARSISDALRSSALQLEDRLHREREFAEHASHVLRTPLTGIRLELEELTLRDDVPEDAKEAIGRSLASVQTVDAVAGDLVDLTRRGSLVAGAELDLADLSTQLAQRWADRLAARNRTLAAAVEGDLELTYTPGPVEHVTDLLLADVVRRSAGPVRLVFRGEPGGHLRVHVQAEEHAEAGDSPQLDRVSQVRGVVEALGGRVQGEHPAEGIDVLLPRR
ncbi:sensor histidine kinase [Nocardioides mangrovi]|uniref:histidine kinase n=1 Tax=Nocardioides mangrovi TaxID=2874580 RepID=A0ABS7U972_9ACTN|nr:histidine kinase dimerization/phospho-acceptor domain-containing protein [Nocardioides mangrovi]MBZ5737530.1 hypothetical protein [Nocardioides mangrovi]